MKKQTKSIVVCMFLAQCLFLSACKESTGTGPPVVDSYPLAAGNAWEYKRQFYTYNFRPIVPGATFEPDTFRSVVRVEILGQRILRDSILTWEFKAVETDSAGTYRGHFFYRTILDSLFLYAYTGGSLIVPRPQSPQTLTFVFGGKVYASLQELFSSFDKEILTPFHAVVDTMYEERPPKSFVFPLRTGSGWTYRQRGYPWRMDRRVIEHTFIQTVIGFQPVYRIRWFWDINDDERWDDNLEGYDYVSNQGVMGRTFELRNLIVTTINYPDGIGYIDVREEFELIAISLQ